MDFSFVTWLFDTPQKYIDFSNCIYLHWVGNYKRNYKSLSSNSVTQTKMKGCMNPSKCFYYFDHYTHCKINSSSIKLSLYLTIIKCSNEFTFWWQKKQRGRAGGGGVEYYHTNHYLKQWRVVSCSTLEKYLTKYVTANREYWSNNSLWGDRLPRHLWGA